MKPYASGAGRWIPCPGSVKLQAPFPSTYAPEADEGIEAHAEAARAINERRVVGGPIGVYVNDVLRYPIPIVEQKVEFSHLGVSMNVKPDTVAIDHVKRELIIWDYKHGFGPVSPVENWQMIVYACAIIARWHLLEEGYTVVLKIVQPRAYGPDIKIWTFPSEYWRNYANQIVDAYNSAMSPNPLTKSGPHCRYCRAAHVCHSADAAAKYSIDCSTTALNFDLDDDSLSCELYILRRAADALKSKIMALESHIAERIKKGRPIPGWIMSSGKGKRTWKRDPEEIKALGSLLGINLEKMALITPTQAIEAGIPEVMVAKYSAFEYGGITLKPEEHINQRAKEIFSK